MYDGAGDVELRAIRIPKKAKKMIARLTPMMKANRLSTKRIMMSCQSLLDSY